MNRTVNRTPIQVPIPSSKDRYFNHIEWKGINDNKNVMGIDQQTFAEAENVYVNTEDILTSRPPITMRNKWGLEGQIVKFWAFGEHIAVQTLRDDIYRIHFVYQDELIEIEDNIVDKDITVILLTRKIFVLSASQFSAYDIVDNIWERDARAYIYVPRDTEEDNLLIEGTRKNTYIWTQVSPPPWNYFASLDQEIQVVIDGKTYTLTYELGAEKTWVSKFTEVLNNTTGARIFKARDADTFAFVDTILYYSQSGTDFQGLTDTPVGFNIVTISDNGDGIYGYYKSGVGTYIVVYNVLTNTWTGLADNGTSSFVGDNRDIAFISADSQFNFFVGVIPDGTSSGVSPHCYVRLPAPTFTGSESWLGVLGNPYNKLQCGRIRWVDESTGRNYNSTAYMGNSKDDWIDTTDALYNYEYDTPRIIVNNIWYDTSILSYRFGGYSSVNIFPVNLEGTFKFVKTSIDSFQCFRRGTINICRGLLPVIQYPDIQRLFVFECTMANGGPSQLLSTIELDVSDNQNLANIIFGDDFTIITEKEYFVPKNTNINTPLADITFTRIDNLFPDYIPIANGLRLTPEDGMRRIWSQAPGETGTNLYVTNAGDLDELISPIEIIVSKFADPTYMYFEHWLEWDDVILSQGRDTYVAQYKTNRDGVFSWYITKSGRQNFNFNITGLHLLSNTEMAIFMEHEIWIATMQPGSGDIANLYYYNKSKLPIGIRKGSDVMTTFDGRYILFSCERGLVALQYQQFLATTEQALTFISDNIAYDEFNTGPIKLYQYKFWVVVYRIDRGEFFLLDMRNQSWWKWTFKQPIKDIVTYNEVPLALSQNDLFVLGDDTNYTDDGDEIKWKITSQLLHFDAINNFKQILSLILNSVDTEDRFVFSLQTINYRKESNTRRREVFEYDVDTIRTFIKRMQFSKVNEFQYQLRNADKSLTPVPLKLTDISIKYIVTERVR